MGCRVNSDVVTFAHPQLTPAVCSILGISPLQEVVQEQLEPAVPLEHLDTVQVGLKWPLRFDGE